MLLERARIDIAILVVGCSFLLKNGRYTSDCTFSCRWQNFYKSVCVFRQHLRTCDRPCSCLYLPLPRAQRSTGATLYQRATSLLRITQVSQMIPISSSCIKALIRISTSWRMAVGVERKLPQGFTACCQHDSRREDKHHFWHRNFHG